MAWCPVCKNEYRAGITVCPDCNEILMEELKENLEFVSLFQTDNEEMKNKIIAYLAHCSIQTSETSEEAVNEETGEPVLLYTVSVSKNDLKEASMELRTVLTVTAEADGPTAELKRRRPAPEPSTVYVDAKDRYDEYRSSGVMFLGFAAALLIFELLNAAHVITFMNTPFSMAMMTLLVGIFLVIGVTSLRKTKTLRVAAEAEQSQTVQLNAFLAEHFPKKVLDAMAEEDMSKEILYLKQLEIMKEKISEEYPDLEETYVDALLEDYYNSLEEA